MLFRTQENVPEVYINESRDFQLLCRLKDVIFGGVKYNIDSLNHTSNTLEMNARLLSLLKSKLGFFEQEQLTEDELRYLLAGFSDLIKYKGSKKAIKKAVFLWFRVTQLQGKLTDITIDNDNYLIRITMDASSTDTKLLDEIFKYILPTGYKVIYMFASDNIVEDSYILDESYIYLNVHNKVNSNIRIPIEDDFEDKRKHRLMGSVGFTQIMSYDDFYTSKVGEPSKDVIYPEREIDNES